MRWPGKLRLRLRSLFRSGRVESELGEELQFHLEHLVDDFVRSGMSPKDARYAALREMGAIESRKEECRDARGVAALIDTVRQDVTYALRALRRAPAFTAVAILSLALGIGANTAIFSLWNSVLYASLPGVHEPGQLVMLSNPDDSGMWSGRWESRTDGPRSWLTYEEFEQLRDHADGFSSMMASQSSLINWQVRFEGGAPEAVSGRLVSGAFFDVLGVGPAIGRLFTTEMDRAAAGDAVISYAFWQRRFGGRPDVLGKTFMVRSTTLTIIGVTPRGFVGETAGQQPDLWLPVRLQPHVLPGRVWLHDTPPEKVMWLRVFGRLKPGVTEAQAEAQANAIFQRGLESFYGSGMSLERRREFLDQRLQVWSAARGASSVRSGLSLSLTALLAAVAVLLLIACANLANLLLARGAARKPEIALRLSLGASRGRILRQLVTESLTLAALGGIAALIVAHDLHDLLVQMLAASNPRFSLNFVLDPLVLAFVLAVTLAAALLFGVLPAWQVTKADAGTALKEQSRSTIGSSGQIRSGRVLVGLQLALSLPLLVGAGLLVQTVYNLQRADLGYPAERLLLVRVDLREATENIERRGVLLRELRGQILQVPGVRAASYSEHGVFSGGTSSDTIEVEGYTPKGDRDRDSAVEAIGPGYFSTMGIPMFSGREIQEGDHEEGLKVCVINEAFARRFFDRREPIGFHVTTVDDENGRMVWQFVGVARNARTEDLRGDIEPRYFVPARHRPSTTNIPTLAIRTVADSATVMTAVRDTIRRVNAALVIVSARSLGEQVAPLVAQDRAIAQLTVVFGIVALTLVAIGLYGTLAYGIARRTNEIAIRIALGAPSGRVVSMILRETVGLVVAGFAFGGGLAYFAARFIDNRLYGVSPQDPLTLVLATGLLLAVALTAAYFPARRASRVDPATVLR